MLKQTPLKKFDDEKRIVWGEVYVPDVIDTQGDFMTADEIEKMAYAFILKSELGQIDVMHDNVLYGCKIVETFIARKGDDTFIPGSWVLGVHIPDGMLWQKVKDGELNGFSMQAEAYGTEVEKEITVPVEVNGMTCDHDGHTHRFTVKFDPEGKFLGGETSVDNGHSHVIVRGTATEPQGGHSHRFSFVEGLVE